MLKILTTIAYYDTNANLLKMLIMRKNTNNGYDANNVKTPKIQKIMLKILIMLISLIMLRMLILLSMLKI